MASLIVCTPGGKDDNCYVTLVQATVYFANTLRAAAWDALAVTLREQALIQATREIEDLGGARLSVRSPTRSRFAGTPYRPGRTQLAGAGVSDAQALHFPRTTDVADDGVTKLIPADLRAAGCEQAVWLLGKQSAPDLVDRDALQAAGVKQLTVDGLAEVYGPREVPAGICPAAWERLRHFTTGGASGNWYGTI